MSILGSNNQRFTVGDLADKIEILGNHPAEWTDVIGAIDLVNLTNIEFLEELFTDLLDLESGRFVIKIGTDRERFFRAAAEINCKEPNLDQLGKIQNLFLLVGSRNDSGSITPTLYIKIYITKYDIQELYNQCTTNGQYISPKHN